MAKILVTGMPGTGKSSALAELARRGYRVVDTDEPGWREYHAYPQPIDELHRGEFHWVESRMNALLDSARDRVLFVGGSARNQMSFYGRFDAVVLLKAPPQVLLDRVAKRTTNDYGKSDLERAEILADVVEVERLMRRGSTHEVDATRPLAEVVNELMAIARAVSPQGA